MEDYKVEKEKKEMELKVYIRQRRAVIEDGELKGDWFTAPLNFEYIAERLGLERARGQYEILEIECPVKTKLSDKTDIYIDDVNRLKKQLNELEETFPESHIIKITDHWFKSLEHFYHNKDKIGYAKNMDTFDCENITYTYVK